MGGIKVGRVADLNGIRLVKGITVEEFKSWIVSTLNGTGSEEYHSVIQSPDGGYITVGYQNTEGQGSYDALIVKYDSNLNVVSQHGLGSAGNDMYRSIVQSNDGGYVIAGYQLSEGQGGYDALIVKYDSNLNLVSQHGLGGTSEDYYMSVIQSSDGGYVAVGNQESEGQGSRDALIVKYDSNLNVTSQHGLGGTGNDYYESVIQSSDGGYVVVGSQESEGQGSRDALIVKYDSNLNLVSQHGLGGSSSDYYESVIQSSDGGYVAVGYQDSQSQGINDPLIVKYDSNLNVTSQHGLGGTGNDLYRSVVQSSDGGYVAVGQHASQSQGGFDTLIVKYDSNLNLVSQYGLGTSVNDYYNSVIQSSDGSYVAVGTYYPAGQSSLDALITKLPSDLTLLTGTLTNHTGMQWTTPTMVETTPTMVETTPTLTVTTPTLTVTTPTLTVTTPTLNDTRSEKQ